MIDLYEILGVDEDATDRDIRKAYRKKVKRAHPEAPGGSKEKFEELKLAHDVLMNADRRAYYDSTGKIKPDDPDNGRNAVLAVLASALSFCINAAAEKEIDPRTEDMIDAICLVLKKKRHDLNNQLTEINKHHRMYTELAGRFKGKDGDDVLDAIVTGTLTSVEGELRVRKDAIANVDAALKLAQTHTFRRDLVRARVMMGGQSTSTTPFIFR